jgi:hypothetical protein
MPVTFSYDFVTAPLISQVRMLIPDTDYTAPIFGDDEINQAIFIESSQGLYCSGQANPVGNSVSPPVQVYSIRRAAALLVDVIAGNNARLGIIQQLLDVKLDSSKAVVALRAYADSLRQTEAMSGAFAITEMVVDPFSARERVFKQILRLYPG